MRLDSFTSSQLIDGLLNLQAGLIVAYGLSAVFVLSNKYGGTNAGLLGIIFLGFLYATHQGIKQQLSRTSFGGVLAGAVFLTFMSLQSAIFWGQYSNCSKLEDDDFDNECHHVPAMKAVCTFSVFLFLSYLAQVFILLRFKDEILGDARLDEGYQPVRSVEDQPVSGANFASSAPIPVQTNPVSRVYPVSADL